MRTPAPIHAPLRMGDIDSRITSPAWMEWFQRLSDYYEAAPKFIDPKSPLFGQSAPASPSEGLLAFADGTNWDPAGIGLAGVYIYEGGAWKFTGAILPASTVTSETAFGVLAAVGTSVLYARADHTHGSPTDPLTTSTFTSHKARHENGGADEISLAGLSGEAADEQKSKLASATVRGGVKIGDVFTVDGSEFLVLTVSASGGIEKSASAIAIKVRSAYGITVDADGIQLKKQAAEADDATPTATDLPTAITLANALQTKVNNILAKLRSAEVIAT